MPKVFNLKFIPTFFLIILSTSIGQDYNPCKDKRFISLIKIDLDDMSDREYNYFIKKEEECSKYKMKKKKKKKKPSKSRKKNNVRKRVKKKPNKKPLKETSYLPGIYFSSPIMRLQMTSKYENISISGLKLETPISVKIANLNPYLVFEYRSYIFSYADKERREILGDFGGKAFLGGLKFPFEIFKIKPEFSIMTGKFHYKKGVLFCLDIPQKLSSDSPFKIKYSIKTNIIQASGNHGTGWVEVGLSLGYSINEKMISSIKDLF